MICISRSSNRWHASLSSFSLPFFSWRTLRLPYYLFNQYADFISSPSHVPLFLIFISLLLLHLPLLLSLPYLHFVPLSILLLPPQLIKFQHSTLLLELMPGPWNTTEKRERLKDLENIFSFAFYFFFVPCLRFFLSFPPEERERDWRTWRIFLVSLFIFSLFRVSVSFFHSLQVFLIFSPPFVLSQCEIFVLCMWRVRKLGCYCPLNVLLFCVFFRAGNLFIISLPSFGLAC